MNAAEIAILQVIERWGLQCTRINESSCKSPDFLVSDDRDRYYVELKAKYESPIRAKDRQDGFGIEQIFTDSLELRGTAAYRSVVKKAYKQLKAASHQDPEPLRIPWLLCLGLQASVDVERFINVFLVQLMLQTSQRMERQGHATSFTIAYSSNTVIQSMPL